MSAGGFNYNWELEEAQRRGIQPQMYVPPLFPNMMSPVLTFQQQALDISPVLTFQQPTLDISDCCLLSSENVGNETFGRVHQNTRASARRSGSRTDDEKKVWFCSSQPQANHSISERKRRSAIKERFNELSDLVPLITPESNKVDILQETIDYIKRLKLENEKLKRL